MNSLEVILKLFKEEKIDIEEASTLIKDLFQQNVQWYPYYTTYPSIEPYKIEPYKIEPYKITCTQTIL